MFELNNDILKVYDMYGDSCVIKNNQINFNRPNDCLYCDIKFIFPLLQDNTFHSMIGIDNNKLIISDTNSYLEDIASTKNSNYNNRFTVYSRINITYNYLINNNVEGNIEDEICYFMTPFDSVNLGHNLSIIFDFIYKYKKMNLDCPIVLSEYSKKYPNALKILQLFFPNNKILFIENNKIYSFKKIYIFKPIVFNIMMHRNVIRECVDKNNLQITNIDYYKNKNIVLIKTNTNTNVVRKQFAFNAKKFQEVISNIKDWIFIDPEKTSIYEIIPYLLFANKIVTCHGSINYAHAPFFNINAKIFYLRIPHSNDRPYFPHPNQKIINVPLDLDSILPELLNNLEL